MKNYNFNYHPSTSDVKTMLTVLTVTTEILPFLEMDDFSDDAKQQTLKYASSAINRLQNMDTRISLNEMRAIYNSLIIADMVNHKEIVADDLSSELCSDNTFTIQKLLPVFEEYFSSLGE